MDQLLIFVIGVTSLDNMILLKDKIYIMGGKLKKNYLEISSIKSAYFFDKFLLWYCLFNSLNNACCYIFVYHAPFPNCIGQQKNNLLVVAILLLIRGKTLFGRNSQFIVHDVIGRFRYRNRYNTQKFPSLRGAAAQNGCGCFLCFSSYIYNLLLLLSLSNTRS